MEPSEEKACDARPDKEAGVFFFFPQGMKRAPEKPRAAAGQLCVGGFWCQKCAVCSDMGAVGTTSLISCWQIFPYPPKGVTFDRISPAPPQQLLSPMS